MVQTVGISLLELSIFTLTVLPVGSVHPGSYVAEMMMMTMMCLVALVFFLNCVGKGLSERVWDMDEWENCYSDAKIEGN